MLTFTIGCNTMLASTTWGGISIGCLLMVLTYGLGGISGAFFNPAICVASWMHSSMGGCGIASGTLVKYSLVQVLGAILGSVGASLMCHGSMDLTPSLGFGWFRAGLCELLYTFMLCFVALAMRVRKEEERIHHFGIATGFVMIAGLYGGGAISHGYFNPAVVLGLDVPKLFSGGFGWSLIYIVFQMVGAVLAVLLFRVVRPEEFNRSKRGPVPELASELIGPFMIVLTLGLNIMGKSPATGFAVAASLISMTYALSGVSGAHFNPAVTLAVMVSGRELSDAPPKTVLQVFSSMFLQIAGGVLGAMLYTFIYFGGSFRLGPGSQPANWAVVNFAEFFFTFLLCYVFLCLTVSQTTRSGTVYGLAIGSCLTVGMNSVGAISGGALNPAVAIGIAASHRFSEGSLYAAGVYSLTHLVAGVFGAIVFKATHNGVDSETKGEH